MGSPPFYLPETNKTTTLPSRCLKAFNAMIGVDYLASVRQAGISPNAILTNKKAMTLASLTEALEIGMFKSLYCTMR